jgi:hypothetical protein
MAIKPAIRLSEQDYNRLRHLLAELVHQSIGIQATLQIVETLLDRANIVRSEKVPESVAAMNSRAPYQDVGMRERAT